MGVAEGSGSRTHQTRRAPLDGFEARARHRTGIPSTTEAKDHDPAAQYLASFTVVLAKARTYEKRWI